ncbi:DUF6097 family protein [Acinetobacter gerneri]|uniref:DUF6097 family protein n=1 Tax=Acinetobacter gerneri TaxID=202952 RepID=UPI0028A67740|nr:DUF6097 family protein [Acinetobacter gerneri]
MIYKKWNLHKIIYRLSSPILSKDNLNDQIIEIEKYFGENEFSHLSAKRKLSNIGTGLLALPVLIYCLFLFGSRYAKNFGIDIDATVINHSLLVGVIDYLWIVIIYAILFVGLVIYFYKLNTQLNVKTYSVANKLFASLQ